MTLRNHNIRRNASGLVMAGTFAAKLVRSSGEITVAAGETVEVWADFKNIGVETWTTQNTRLGTANQIDRASNFATLTWLAANRPCSIDNDTPSGTFGRFRFSIKAPLDYFGQYEECFDIVHEGVAWANPSSKWTIKINVVASSTYVSKPAAPIENVSDHIPNLAQLENHKICMISTWDIKCGISQYCRNLYTALLSKNYKVDIFNNNEPYENVYNFIISNGCRIFIIQYEPAIIKDIGRLIDYIVRLKRINNKIKIYFIVHSENQDLHSVDGKIDGFIYHKINKMMFNNTKCFVVPMGVPIFNPAGNKSFYRRQYNVAEDKFIISTVGFMFGWKKHAEFLERIANKIKNDPNLIVQMMTSFHTINNRECTEECNKIRAVIANHQLHNQVIHITDYVSQEELSGRLYMSNVGFLYAGMETSSSSASLKEFVSARLPLIKTDSNHHHDITIGCITTNKDMGEFVNKIISVYNNKFILNGLQQEMENCYNKLNYERTVNNFVDIFNNNITQY